ncbi:MAG: hypothetical protein ACYDB0_09280, partial [Acidithiobacillus sp.]
MKMTHHSVSSLIVTVIDFLMRIPAIVGSDSADRGHPRKAYILVIAILGMGGHDASNFGVTGV